MKKSNKVKYYLGSLGLFALVVVIALMVLGGSPDSPSGQSSAKSYSKTDQNRPKAVLSQTKIDWGKIKVSDTQYAEIELKNEGAAPLEVTRMSTSCGCTSVKAIYPDNRETKEYGMHKTSELVTVAPGTSVMIKVVYKPYTMPVEGAVTRNVFLETNDPELPKLTIDASAVVQK